MKQLTGTAQREVKAAIESCFALLSDVESYPRWYPDVVREVTALDHDADGLPQRAQATLHVARGPLVHDFHLTLDVERHVPGAVTLTRGPHEPTDPEEFRVAWRLQPSGAGTRIQLDLGANLSVPRMLPLGGIGDSMAQGFVEAAVRAVNHTP